MSNDHQDIEKAEKEAKRLIDRYMKVIKERVDVFNAYTDLSFAKECASICAERVEESIYVTPVTADTFTYRKERLKHWQLVRDIINKTKTQNEP